MYMEGDGSMEQKEQGSSASPEEEQVKKESEARKESRKERKAAKKRARKERKAARKAEKRAAYQALDKRERVFFQGKRAAAVLQDPGAGAVWSVPYCIVGGDSCRGAPERRRSSCGGSNGGVWSAGYMGGLCLYVRQ